LPARNFVGPKQAKRRAVKGSLHRKTQLTVRTQSRLHLRPLSGKTMYDIEAIKTRMEISGLKAR